MIQLYNPENTDYTQNGDITLLPTMANIHVILNGAWSAELSHPIDDEGRWKYIQEEAVIKMPSFLPDDQLFRIKKATKSDSGVVAEMEPIFYDSMGDCWLDDIRPTGDSGQTALNLMLSPNSKYSGSSNISKAATAYYQNVNFMEALNGDIQQSFINRWGGEILFNNYTVIVNTEAGGDYGVELRYGKNIPTNGMSEEVDTRDVVTRIYPKGYNGVMMSNNGYVDSPLINNYPTIKSATITFENIKMAADAQEGDEDNGSIICNSQSELDSQLTLACQQQFENGIDKPNVTISADMVLLQNTEQYSEFQILESVSLGDTIHCINNHLNIVTDARVKELEYDSISKKVSSVVIGDFEPGYFDGVTSNVNKIEAVIRPDGSLMAEKIQGILNGIWTQLRIQSNAAEKVEGRAFLVEDTDEESSLYGAMCWGTQGLQIASQRTPDGRDWDWTTAITAQGIVANTIITGILSDKTGRNYWNLDTGEFRLSADAFQIDDQTAQDYIEGEIDNKIAQIRTLTVQLTNEFAGVPTNSEGGNGDYAECYTDVKVYIGTTDITESEVVTYTVNPSSGVIGNWDVENHRYTVTGMTTDTGNVSFTVTYSGLAMTKQFNIAKIKQGSQGVPGPANTYTWIKYADSPTSGMSDEPSGKSYLGLAYNKDTPTESDNYSDYEWSLIKGTDGENGVPGRTYFLVVNPIVVSQSADGTYNPSGISVGSFYRDGDSAERSVYNGTLVFEESEDGTSFTKTGEYNFSQYGYTIQGEKIKAVRITMCVLNDTDSALDVQTVTIVRDTDNLTQEEIFNILTNNGETQGIFMQDGKLYINLSYAKAGTLSADYIKGGHISADLIRGGSISADLIQSGSMSADRLTGGTIRLGRKPGVDYGEIRIESPDGVEVGEWTTSGVTFGEINDAAVDFTHSYSNTSMSFYVNGRGCATINTEQGDGLKIYGNNRVDISSRGSIYLLSGTVFESAASFDSDVRFYEQAQFWVASKMYNLSHVTSGGHIVFAQDGQTLAYLASSSKKYKEHVRDLTDEEAEKLLNARVVWFKYKENYLNENDPMKGKEIPGFYAEEIEEIYPVLAQYNDKGEVEDWNYRTMIPLMMQLIKKQSKEIDDLKKSIEDLKSLISK